MEFFNDVPLVVPRSPPEEVLGKGIDLTITTFRTSNGNSVVLPVVRHARIDYAERPYGNHDYLPILGHEGFREMATELALGKESPAIVEKRAMGVQCLSGTGALGSGADFLAQVCKLDTVYFSNPTWDTHRRIFAKAGFTNIREYTYWDYDQKCINIQQLLVDLKEAPEKSVVVLHACAHSPTGMDPSPDMWRAIADVVKRQKLFTFFDFAYQGLASGDPDTDAWAIRYFVDQGLEMFVAQSFAFNFGLYNDRVGNLIVVMNNPKNIENFPSQKTRVNVSKFSNPPAIGACTVYKILSTPLLKSLWLQDVQDMYMSIKRRRLMLSFLLTGNSKPWYHIDCQTGIFNFLGLTKTQTHHLINEHNVNVFRNGCFNIAALNMKNIDIVAKAIEETVENVN
uniref:aspartate transaminase n=1 Tax=Caenorhabditis tropicalis TaxID=1561998 RepID=A0A1I7TZ79_9PELO